MINLPTGSSSCTVDFIPRNSILNALTSGGGPQGAMGMKKKKNEMLTQARHEQQSIFTNQHFNCTGMLTEWIFAGRWNDRNEGFPQLQIWRLTESSSNTYTNIANSTVVVPTKLASQIYSYIPDPPLNVLNGDVVGIHQPEGRKSKLTIYFYHSANLFYYKDKIKEPLHQLSINDNNILTADSLPMISVVIGKNLFIRLNIYPSTFIHLLNLYLSIYLPIYLSIYLSIYVYVCMCVCLYAGVYLCLCVCMNNDIAHLL